MRDGRLYFSRISLPSCFRGVHGLPSSCPQVLGVTSRELIPKGTRFGPLVGECYPNETLLRDANRKYFWRVSQLHVNCGIFLKVIYFCMCASQNRFTSCVSKWRGCCSCSVARVSSCGRHLTSCESVTMHANAWVHSQCQYITLAFSCLCTFSPAVYIAFWGHKHSCLVSVTQWSFSASLSSGITASKHTTYVPGLLQTHTLLFWLSEEVASSLRTVISFAASGIFTSRARTL